MKIIVDREHSNMITAITNVCEEVSNGLQCDEFILSVPEGDFSKSPFDIYDVEVVPDGVKVVQYCYDATNGFTKNLNYEPPYDAEIEIESLRTALLETQNALNMLLGV